MKKMKIQTAINGLLIIFTVSLSCSDSRAPLDRELLARNLARVTIDLNMPDSGDTVSFIERFLRFFSTEAVAQTAPVVESITVLVTGPDMAPVTVTINGTASTIYVPAGLNRFFDIQAHGPSVTFRGTNTATLAAGSSVSLPVSMSLFRTKLIIPDEDWSAGCGYNGGRIRQVDNFTGAGFTEIDNTDFGFSPGTFRPWGIDFDARGRIYISNNQSNPDNVIIRIDNIQSTTHEVVVSPIVGAGGIKAMAIDRQNNYLYHSRGDDLYRKDLATSGNGASISTVDFTSPSIVGIAVDSDGILYIADANNNQVAKFNPDTASIIGTPYTANINLNAIPNNCGGGGRDGAVMVKGKYLFIANPSGPDDYKLIKLETANMSLTGNYGTGVTTTNTSPGMFYGPCYFVAMLNDLIYIIDEGYDGSNQLDKLVSINNITGNGWNVYSPATPFEFFGEC